jgi:hypothetical protein
MRLEKMSRYNLYLLRSGWSFLSAHRFVDGWLVLSFYPSVCGWYVELITIQLDIHRLMKIFPNFQRKIGASI